MDIQHLTLYPREFAVEGLERAYQRYKDYPPTAIAFSDDDGNQLWHWEDVAILHFLPTFEAKRSYYWILQTRDKVLNCDCSIEERARTINYYLSTDTIK